MGKTPPPAEFKIHVDSSCLSDSTDLQMAPTERVVSDQTVVHHDSWGAESPPLEVEDKAADKVAAEEDHKEEDLKAEDLKAEDLKEEDPKEEDPREEDLKTEDPKAEDPKAEDPRTEDPRTEDLRAEDLKEKEIESMEAQNTRDARERQIDRIEAQIQAAARAVVASIEQDRYGGHEDSVLSTQTDESYDEGSQITYDEGTELTYGDGTELTYDGTETTYEPHSDHDEEVAADSSSHHDGDIDDDDVFSHKSGHSARSSLNSVHDLSSADEIQGKELTSPTVGEEAIHSSPALEEQETISRIPSAASYIPRDATPATPSKILSRPPFRTPSSVRAIQMTSPPPSLFSSPRSSKRHLPTVSRNGTPSSFSSPSKNKTPTRYKVKKEYPLILLHVTVFPLSWTYSHIISSPELPLSLQRVKENWRLLQEKLGDTVLERGILLPHPQDSYEVLEERLLEALELPVRPRARILKCGHYMGPDTPTSSDEEGKAHFETGIKVDGNRGWCDICGRNVRFEGVDMAGREGEKRFRIKIYASNGLMRAGAWAACWREMERVDVEIQPFVESHLVAELEEFAIVAVAPKIEEQHHDDGDGFVDEDIVHETEHEIEMENQAQQDYMRAQEEEMARSLMEEDDLRRRAQEEEAARSLMEEENLRRRAQEEEDMHRKIQKEQRMREIYGQDPSPGEEHGIGAARRASKSAHDDDSLPDLLLKAFKVAVRDKKNVVICVLSVVILLLALKPGISATQNPGAIMMNSPPEIEVMREVRGDPIQRHVDMVVAIPAKPKGPYVDTHRERLVVTNNVHSEKPAVEVVNSVQREELVVGSEAKEEPVDTPLPEITTKHTPPSPDTPALRLPLEDAIESAQTAEVSNEILPEV